MNESKDAHNQQNYETHEISALDHEKWELLQQAIQAQHERMYIENELKKQQQEIKKLQQKLAEMRRPPLIIGTVVDIIDQENLQVRTSGGPQFIIKIPEKIEPQSIKAGTRVAMNKDTMALVRVLTPSKDVIVRGGEVIEKPSTSYDDIGGLEDQIKEIIESVELPLTKPQLFKKVGIEAPKGILLIGSPGTGKTLIAQAVAHHTNATFIHIVGSELVQKYIGEGSRLVRELFMLAREKSPSIVFIDELDAIGAKRLESGTTGDREVQRTLMQLLAELDGFDPRGDVRVIAATNRPDILDNALMRPGRFDRIIEVPMPDVKGLQAIFKIHTRRMKVSKDVDIEHLANRLNGHSGAVVKGVCTEAGMFAIRNDRYTVKMADFEAAVKKLLKEPHEGSRPGVMFG
ncbi:MAG: proteasome-activating nucleotidase [Thermoplasmata archaeon]|nr:proteasome-activating nucleotidase [Thermoplasmata archaeon]